MRRRGLLRRSAGIGAVGLAALAGCTGGEDDGLTFEEGFEDGVGDWAFGAAIGPEVDLDEFDWEASVSEEEAASGDGSLRIWNQGDYDDGVTWATHPIAVDAGESYRIEVTGQFWSESESFNTIRHALMRLGPEPPETEEDFPQPGLNTTDLGETPYGGLRDALWLADGWREYAFEWTTPELSTDTLHLSVGTAVIWEADATHYVDDLAVTVEPR
ncbi:hypothetical protein [Halorubrum lipolyticum]|uniref:CBM-cenC domain-containing protein n=1 Tax=Halorubrum lipolyticum DSM 21995 TaxID=1227482 RepID=M0NI28_9EURY|nr:hypothetical protein [Halorubrum lipolyticum]EMA57228.1 hypothetical protein C469_15888 [Halorubrum lipolyticum DSM 21995]